MKKVKVEESIGMILGHDLTRIVPGEFKGAAFKKGHIIKAEDIEILKNMGKDNIYIFELGENQIHENEAAIRMARSAAGDNIKLSNPSEGKVSFVSQKHGLLKINKNKLKEINCIEHVSMATLHNNMEVKPEQIVAGTRIIPLMTEIARIQAVEQICEKEAVIQVKAFKKMNIGIIITGNEVYYGRIEDKFAPVLKEKMQYYGCEILSIVYSPDDAENIKKQIEELVNMGVDAIITAGGMSIDPDDVTPEGIRITKANIISYGAPVLPGAMFMMAYKQDIPIMGIPACGMFHKITVFDLVFIRVLTGEKISKQDIAELGYGGLCQNCDSCTYPACSFGKA